MDIQLQNKKSKNVNFLNNVNQNKVNKEIKSKATSIKKETSDYLIHHNYTNLGWHIKNDKLKENYQIDVELYLVIFVIRKKNLMTLVIVELLVIIKCLI